MLRQVCDDLNVECLGYLPRSASLEQGSRYLGLDFSEHAPSSELTRLLERYTAWQRLLDCTCSTTEACKAGRRLPRRVTIARNGEAFSFLYQEVLDGYEQTVFFDPETEVPDLDDTDLLYLPGGYPEKHLEALAANEDCRMAIKAYAGRGGHVVAECGGMMYLCRNIVSDEGQWPMCDVLPYSITARKQDRKLSLGYRRFVLDGREYRGHEFHYTQFMGQTPASACQVYDAKGNPVSTPVLKYKNVLASYTHLYAGFAHGEE